MPGRASVAAVEDETHDRGAPAPAGLRVRADPGLRRLHEGRMLVGGVGMRVVRLSEQGSAVVGGWLAGRPVAAGLAERQLSRRLLSAGLLHPVVAPVTLDEVAAESTVVVPVRSDSRLLEQLLKRLQGVRVVVVDDGSADEAGVRAAAERFGAELVRRPSSGGPGQARNDGLAAVDTPLVAFVDIDTECSADHLARLAGHFADSAVVAVAPRITSARGPSLLERYEAHYSPLDLGDAPAAVGPGRTVAYVPSAVLMARTEALRDAGGFDPELRYGEDVDLIWRLVAAGGIVRYAPEVAVDHLPRRTWAQWLRQRFDYGSAAAPLARRHGTAVAPARCSATSAAMWALIALRRPADALALGARSLKPIADSLDAVPNAYALAARLALRGHRAAGRGLAVATGRVWWPLAVCAGLAARRLRAPLAAAVLAGPLLEYAAGRRPADPLRTIALRVLDQAAYGTGVWRGMARDRSIAALLPDLVGKTKSAGNRVRRLEPSGP